MKKVEKNIKRFNMRNSWIMLLLLFFFTVCAKAQLVPQDAMKGMVRVINIGNTLESPGEGDWGNPPIQERAFDDYKNAGFNAIRIPITWDKHTSASLPYSIVASWLNRVEQVVDWGLKRGLIIIINAHHEDWIKNSYTPANKARFDSIWSQIATRLKDKSDSLIFEIINEPYPMTLQNVNDLNARTLKIIRMANPTRIVSFSGYQWSNSAELVTAAIPDSNDKYLMGYYHSYDPYPFGLNGPGTYGSNSDINATKAKFDQVNAWSNRNKIPVILGEFGYQIACEYNSRMCAYATVVDQGLRHGIPTFTWDDGGNFPIYNRTTGGFNEIKDVLIHTYKESPNTMKISAYADSSIKIQWTNRTTENDSIIVERKVDASNFGFFARILPTASEFIDSTTSAGRTYYYRLKANLKDSIEIQSYPVRLKAISTTSVAMQNVPAGFKLFNNYPNPFNPSTTISFSLPSRSFVTLKVYDVIGRDVATIVSEDLKEGIHTRQWNAQGLSSGVYYYRIQAGYFTETKKLMVLK